MPKKQGQKGGKRYEEQEFSSIRVGCSAVSDGLRRRYKNCGDYWGRGGNYRPGGAGEQGIDGKPFL